MERAGEWPVGRGRVLARAARGRQIPALEELLRGNVAASSILHRGSGLGLPSWYLGAGAVAQTVWNQLHGFDPAHGIKDYDLVYFDADDLSAEREQAMEDQAARLFADLDVRLDVTNEARVHLWYEQRFGRSIPPYRSAEEAIATWPATASSVGVRYDDDQFVVCAPFGLADLFAMVVRANKAIVGQAVYEEKAGRWARRWPMLAVIPW